MSFKRASTAFVVLLLLTFFNVEFVTLPTSQAASFASPDFANVWNRTDKQVLSGAVARSYLWGPEPFSEGLQEEYADAPDSKRLVQYFDKTRMELTNPAGDKSNPYYITNGLLAKEMISGRLQLGNNKFVAIDTADIGVAGDGDDTSGPTYSALNLYLLPTASGLNTAVSGALDRLGNLRGSATEFGKYDVKYVYFEPLTGHNVAKPFWDYLNQSGPTLDATGKSSTGRIFDPVFYATGLPITEAFWGRVKVAGQLKDVLVQAFERRVLTYTPANPAGFQVEMGNVGRHYYQWRYVQSVAQLAMWPVANGFPAGPAPKPAAPSAGTVAVDLETPAEFKVGSLTGSYKMNLPPGFTISTYAKLQDKARMMAVSPDGVVFVTETNGGRVVLLKDKGKTAERVVFAEGLDTPHGLAFYRVNNTDYLYVAEHGRVVRFAYQPGLQKAAAPTPEVIVPDVPKNGTYHKTRTIAFGKDGKMYVSLGGGCNFCEAEFPRGGILQFNPDGTGRRVYSQGMRNGVGLAVHPVTGELWETENSRDLLGDEMPPDEINVARLGGHYGWPYCISNGVWDDKADDKRNQGFCDTTISPVMPIAAHSAPLGLSFYSGQQFPAEYQGDAFVGLHGTATGSRAEKIGFSVVRVRVQNGRPVSYENFVTGWLLDDKKTNWGRPVMPITAPDGSLLVTDDGADAVFKISYTGPK